MLYVGVKFQVRVWAVCRFQFIVQFRGTYLPSCVEAYVWTDYKHISMQSRIRNEELSQLMLGCRVYLA
jgi:hypothetical protein